MTDSTIASQLEQQLYQTFAPTHLHLENESHMHSGYVDGKESHFKLTLVSEHFDTMRLVKRHQSVYLAVSAFLTSGGGVIHALAIHAYTPSEWQAQVQAPDSPHCANKR